VPQANNRLQRTALRAAAEPERYADQTPRSSSVNWCPSEVVMRLWKSAVVILVAALVATADGAAQSTRLHGRGVDGLSGSGRLSWHPATSAGYRTGSHCASHCRVGTNRS